MGGGTSLSSHRAGFGVFRSKALSKSTAQSAFADSENCNDYAITTSNAAHSPRNDKGYNPLPLGEGGTQCRVRVKKAAFTLAEVLITLAIIGIVAALTIPTLVQNFQQDAWDTASEVFQRKLEESLKVMNVQGTLAGYTTTEAFVDELSKYIKITRICDNDDITTCFSDAVTWGDEEVDMSKVKKAKNFGQEDWDTNTVAVQFANGVNGIIAYNPDCRQNQFSNDVITVDENGIGTTCLAILYDVDGFKNPNTEGKDLKNLNVTSLGGSNCAIELSDGTCFTAPFIPTPLTLAECEAQKGELGISECYYDGDYWAGAVKACHDMGSSLPSLGQLDQLARDLYPGTEISTTGISSGTRDNDLAVSMGFISSPRTDFRLWSSEEGSKYNACHRYFGSTTTYWYGYNGYGTYRNNSTIQAVCLGD